MKYALKIEKDADYLLVTMPEIPELTSVAYKEEDIQKECLDAFELTLDFYAQQNKPIPLPGKVKSGKHALILPSTLAAKIYLYNEWLNSGIDKGEIAKRMDVKNSAVSRLFNFKYRSKIDVIEQALATLGKYIEIKVA